MKNKFSVNIEIPSDIKCELNKDILRCEKNQVSLEKKISIPDTKVILNEGNIELLCEKANKKHRAMINTASAHIRNIIKGLEEKYVYKLEICHVHFPMTVKIENDKLMISNFLGEKTPRAAKILQGVDVDIKRNEITVSSHDIEKAGQTAANIEKATKVPNKDRRIFQDGIFIKEKPGGKI